MGQAVGQDAHRGGGEQPPVDVGGQDLQVVGPRRLLAGARAVFLQERPSAPGQSEHARDPQPQPVLIAVPGAPAGVRRARDQAVQGAIKYAIHAGLSGQEATRSGFFHAKPSAKPVPRRRVPHHAAFVARKAHPARPADAPPALSSHTSQLRNPAGTPDTLPPAIGLVDLEDAPASLAGSPRPAAGFRRSAG